MVNIDESLSDTINSAWKFVIIIVYVESMNFLFTKFA